MAAQNSSEDRPARPVYNNEPNPAPQPIANPPAAKVSVENPTAKPLDKTSASQASTQSDNSDSSLSPPPKSRSQSPPRLAPFRVLRSQTSTPVPLQHRTPTPVPKQAASRVARPQRNDRVAASKSVVVSKTAPAQQPGAASKVVAASKLVPSPKPYIAKKSHQRAHQSLKSHYEQYNSSISYVPHTHRQYMWDFIGNFVAGLREPDQRKALSDELMQEHPCKLISGKREYQCDWADVGDAMRKLGFLPPVAEEEQLAKRQKMEMAQKSTRGTRGMGPPSYLR